MPFVLRVVARKSEHLFRVGRKGIVLQKSHRTEERANLGWMRMFEGKCGILMWTPDLRQWRSFYLKQSCSARIAQHVYMLSAMLRTSAQSAMDGRSKAVERVIENQRASLEAVSRLLKLERPSMLECKTCPFARLRRGQFRFRHASIMSLPDA